MKYLGKTSAKDPHKYKGSGIYWKRHIQMYGYDVTTEILLETKDIEELKEKAIYYSEIWDIVNNNEWANLIPETGTGISTGKKDIHTIYHEDGRIFTGTQLQFRKLNPHIRQSTVSSFISRKIKYIQGWYFDSSLMTKNAPSYTFFKPSEQKLFTGTMEQMIKQNKEVDRGGIKRLISEQSKSHKGWFFI